MDARTFVAGVVAASVAASTCAGADASVAAGARAAAVYGGIVRDGAPVVVIASTRRDQLRSLILGTVLTCADGSWIPVNGELAVGQPSGLPGVPSPLAMSENVNGRFAGSYADRSASGADSIQLAVQAGGQLGSRRAHGWFSARALVTAGVGGAVVTTCTSARASFTAARARGAIFGGTTTQSEPLVLRLNRRTHTVEYFSFSWSAGCNTGAHRYWSLDGWRSLLHATSTGAFSRSIHLERGAAAGHTDVFDYGVSGRIRQRSASGRLWARYAIRDRSASAVERCNTGPLRWRALSG